MLNADVFACADGTDLRCLALDRLMYNFNQDFFGILKTGSEHLDLTFAGDYVVNYDAVDQFNGL